MRSQHIYILHPYPSHTQITFTWPAVDTVYR